MLSVYIIFSLLIGSAFATGCNLREYKDGYVCVCNESHCDKLEFQNPTKTVAVQVTSSASGLRHDVNYTKIYSYDSIPNKDDPLIVRLTTLENIKYQEVLGFGNALTGSSSFLLEKLTPNMKNHVYKSIFSKSQGNGIKFVRIPIGGCDFDLNPWAYNEYPENDKNLTNMTKLDDRDLLKIRQINEIRKIDAHDINFMGAAWSAPRWMKSNNKWSGRSQLKKEYYQTWADYHLKYLELMNKNGVRFWGLSTGNEPLNGELFWLFVRFMSLGWNAQRQAKFVGDHLGPTIRNSQFKDIKLFCNDDQRYTVAWWFQDMEKEHSESVGYIDGLAVHWYWDDFIPPNLLSDHHDRYPDMMIFNTEASLGDKPWESSSPVLGSWSRAEQYIEKIMEDLEHWVNGWIDWNMLLNEQGGPNYVDNFVDAPIIVNSTDYKELYKQPFYYAFGHFSRFITPGSVRFDVQSSDNKLKSLGFLRPDGSKLIISHNSKTTPARLLIDNGNDGYIDLDIAPKSISSILYV